MSAAFCGKSSRWVVHYQFIIKPMATIIPPPMAMNTKVRVHAEAGSDGNANCWSRAATISAPVQVRSFITPKRS